MSTYPQNADAVAAARQHTEADRGDAFAHEAFAHEVQTLARQLYLSCPAASDDDKDFLKDVIRGRYGFKALARLLRIGRQSYRPEHRALVAQLAERWSNPSGELPPTVYTAFSEETRAQGDADLAQHEFEIFPSLASRDSVLDKLGHQLVATRRAIQAVVAMKVG